jgi:hypothetical protein
MAETFTLAVANLAWDTFPTKLATVDTRVSALKLPLNFHDVCTFK